MNEHFIQPHYPQSKSDGLHSIYMAELPIRFSLEKQKVLVQTIYRHIVIGGFDEFGRQIWEMNGLATDAKTGQHKPFGAPFNSGDRIRFWEHKPTHLWRSTQHQVRLFRGSPKEISRLRLQALEAGSKINKADLHYRAWLNPQNSNSLAATLLEAMGKDRQEILLGMRRLYENGTFAGGFPNYKGFEHDLLPGHIPSPTVDPTEVPRPLPRPAEEGFRNLPLPRTRPSDVGSQGSENVGIVSGNGLLQNYQPNSEIGDTELPLNGIFSDIVGHNNNINFAPDISSHIRTDNVVAVPEGATELAEFLPGVGSALKRRSKTLSAQFENRTNNEQSPDELPSPRPRPKLNPITEGFLKDMPDDGRLVLVAEMAGLKGRKDTDKAEAERLARFDVQRKKAQDLEDIKAGKLSTVWDRYGHPKAVRDLLGEEDYQSFVDDRLEAGLIFHATAGLHLLQDKDLFGIAEGTTQIEAPHDKLAELMTPKVMAAAAERAREILTLRKEKPSEAVLLSTELAKRKEAFDAAFEANEPVDTDEMDRFLFYFEAAQKEIGVAEPAIELIPPNWASQVAERFQMPQSEAGTPTDRRAREARVNEHYAELQQSFGPRADDVIAYSLTRAGSTSVQPLGLRPSHL